MTESDTGNGAHEIAFEAFGVRALVSAGNRRELERVSDLLPPGWRATDPEAAEHRFTLGADGLGGYTVTKDGDPLSGGVEFELSLGVLESALRLHVAVRAPGRIFVHAGAVAHGGRAIVLPGKSFAGKTTLVASLVRAGALYYSDEFAVLDEQGLVHPYAKPLSLRGADQRQSDHHVDTLGGIAGDEPLPIGLFAVTSYRPGAEWRPRRLSAGEGALEVLANTVVAQKRPAEAMHAIKRAVEGAVVLEGKRGEADALATLLLDELERSR